jgi:retron-type reverse transcriptase
MCYTLFLVEFTTSFRYKRGVAYLAPFLYQQYAKRRFDFSNVKYSIDRLWSRGQSSWLQIRRPARHYQKKNVVGLERGPLSLVSTTEELLDRKVAAPV